MFRRHEIIAKCTLLVAALILLADTAKSMVDLTGIRVEGGITYSKRFPHQLPAGSCLVVMLYKAALNNEDAVRLGQDVIHDPQRNKHSSYSVKFYDNKISREDAKSLYVSAFVNVGWCTTKIGDSEKRYNFKPGDFHSKGENSVDTDYVNFRKDDRIKGPMLHLQRVTTKTENQFDDLSNYEDDKESITDTSRENSMLMQSPTSQDSLESLDNKNIPSDLLEDENASPEGNVKEDMNGYKEKLGEETIGQQEREKPPVSINSRANNKHNSGKVDQSRKIRRKPFNRKFGHKTRKLRQGSVQPVGVTAPVKNTPVVNPNVHVSAGNILEATANPIIATQNPPISSQSVQLNNQAALPSTIINDNNQVIPPPDLIPPPIQTTEQGNGVIISPSLNTQNTVAQIQNPPPCPPLSLGNDATQLNQVQYGIINLPIQLQQQTVVPVLSNPGQPCKKTLSIPQPPDQVQTSTVSNPVQAAMQVPMQAPSSQSPTIQQAQYNSVQQNPASVSSVLHVPVRVPLAQAAFPPQMSSVQLQVPPMSSVAQAQLQAPTAQSISLVQSAPLATSPIRVASVLTPSLVQASPLAMSPVQLPSVQSQPLVQASPLAMSPVKIPSVQSQQLVQASPLAMSPVKIPSVQSQPLVQAAPLATSPVRIPLVQPPPLVQTPCAPTVPTELTSPTQNPCMPSQAPSEQLCAPSCAPPMSPSCQEAPKMESCMPATPPIVSEAPKMESCMPALSPQMSEAPKMVPCEPAAPPLEFKVPVKPEVEETKVPMELKTIKVLYPKKKEKPCSKVLVQIAPKCKPECLVKCKDCAKRCCMPKLKALMRRSKNKRHYVRQKN